MFYKIPHKLRLDQVELLLASQIYIIILSEIFKDIANLVINSWETLSNEKSSFLSQFTNIEVEFFNYSTNSFSFLSSLSSSLNFKINLVSNTNLIELNSDFNLENLELQKSGLKVRD